MEQRFNTAITPPGVSVSIPLSYGVLSQDDDEKTAYVSGMVGYDPLTNELVGPDLESQVRRTMDNVVLVLTTAGLTLQDVVYVRVYLTDIQRDFAAFNAIYGEYFPGPWFPARTAIGVTLAKPDLLVEVDAVARRTT